MREREREGEGGEGEREEIMQRLYLVLASCPYSPIPSYSVLQH